MPPCRVIEYQSKDICRFSIQCGVKTIPPDTVVACSGCSRGLPAWSWRTWKVGLPGPGGYWTPDWVLTRMGENNSPIPGARMSDDRLVRSLMSSLTWLVAPIFQVSTRPLVE